ncbi:hypothetical protein GCM10010094_30220 [Streptomyces flaveus]|uniref:Uncharacterized protein n=1 Tax=Streptomyces flaveus TaxID=66370 RepID=A0A917QTG2_9ACTN|nr:hypothetical protein GCM10010094_30220 [Streptomyces flaveus]
MTPLAALTRRLGAVLALSAFCVWVAECRVPLELPLMALAMLGAVASTAATTDMLASAIAVRREIRVRRLVEDMPIP